MAIVTVAQSMFVVDTEAERSLSWPIWSRVYCKDTDKLYVNKNQTSWTLINSAGGSSDPDQSPTSSRTIATGKTVVQGRVYKITGDLNLTIQGTATLTII